MTDAELDYLYFQHHDRPGWLAFLKEVFPELTEWEEVYLNEIDDLLSDSKAAKKWHAGMERLRRWGIAGVEDEQACQTLTERISEVDKEYQRMMDQDESTEAKMMFLKERELEDMTKTRKALRASILYRLKPESGLDDNAINIARCFDLARLVETDRHGRMPCPFHKGKDNNFLVKDGFGYCFTCHESCDAIKFQMKINGLSFPDAVRSLATAGASV